MIKLFKCIQCDEEFTFSDKEQNFFLQKGLKLPKRCKSCRKENKNENAFIDNVLEFEELQNNLNKNLLKKQKQKYINTDKVLSHPVENLFVIGNGFDCWQNLETKYDNFYDYYQKHKIEISNAINIEPCEITNNETGEKTLITQFDLLYDWLNPFGENHDEFWSHFEDSLSILDDEFINQYFGKEYDDLNDILLDSAYALVLMKKCFCEWVKNIQLKSKNEKYNFKNSFFINFNYTQTLSSMFNIDEQDIAHIHGDAKHEESIVFGHGEKVETNCDELLLFGQRFKGLYVINLLLKHFKKRQSEQWNLLCLRLKQKKVNLKTIKNIYVLGHSLGKADIYYFKKLKQLVSDDVVWTISAYSNEDRIQILKVNKILQIKNLKIVTHIDDALTSFLI